MAEENNEKNIEKNSMYIEVENEEEILRLQQEVIKSNLSIEDVAKIVGKLQKLLELTKHNTNIGLAPSNKDWEWEYAPYQPYQPYQSWTSATPKVEVNNNSGFGTLANLTSTAAHPVEKVLTAMENVLTSNSSSDKKSTKIRKDIPF